MPEEPNKRSVLNRKEKIVPTLLGYEICRFCDIDGYTYAHYRTGANRSLNKSFAKIYLTKSYAVEGLVKARVLTRKIDLDDNPKDETNPGSDGSAKKEKTFRGEFNSKKSKG